MTAIRLPAPASTARSVFATAWLAVLIGVVFAGPIAWLIGEWLDNPYYEHGILVPLVSLLLAGLAFPQLRLAAGEGDRAGPLLLGAGLSLRLIGAVGGSEFLSAVALLPVLAGLARWWLGADGLRRLAFPIGYLALAIPLPFLDDVGFYFQRLSTISTTFLVRLFGIPATYQGAEVSLPPAQFGAATFFVGVQCSGLYSTITLLALALLFPRLLDLGGWPRQVLLLAAVVPIAVITNDIRLGSILGIAYWQSADVAMAYYHNLGGLVFWLVALVLFFTVGKVLEWTHTRAGS